MSEPFRNSAPTTRIGINFMPCSKILYEEAVSKHPELGLSISEEPIGSAKGHMSLRFPIGNESIDLSDFWRTFWRLKR